MAVAANPMQTKYMHTRFVKNMEDVLSESNVTWNELKSRGKITYNHGSNSLTQQVGSGRIDVGGWGPMHEQLPAQPQILTTAVYTWGGKFLNYYIDEWDLLENQGPDVILKIQKTLMDAAERDVLENMEDNMYTNLLTNDPPEYGGLAAFVKQTGTYAGLTQSSAAVDAYWSPTLLALTSTTFTSTPLGMLTKMYNSVTHGKTQRGANRPTASFMDRTVWNGCHGKIETVRRIVGDNNKIEMGFVNFLNDGVPSYWSDSCPANKVYVVNHNNLEMIFCTPKAFVDRSMETITPIGTVYQMYSKGQLICNNPRMFGLISHSGTLI